MTEPCPSCHLDLLDPAEVCNPPVARPIEADLDLWLP